MGALIALHSKSYTRMALCGFADKPGFLKTEQASYRPPPREQAKNPTSKGLAFVRQASLLLLKPNCLSRAIEEGAGRRAEKSDFVSANPAQTGSPTSRIN